MLIRGSRHIAALVRRSIDGRRRGRLYCASNGTEITRHLHEAAQWLVRAQDSGANHGVAYGADFGGPFLESYPETTGYIIPVFLELARHHGNAGWRGRAIRAGEWESDVQMPEGAVMGGILNTSPTPAVFNTGMVLLGWSALVREAGDDPASGRFRDSAHRACDWLVRFQDPDGCWRRGNSRYANAATTTYNVKAAWGLCEAGYAVDHEAAIEGAVRNAEYCLTQQRANGWFANNCLDDANNPLLHTIAYVMQGLTGIGRLTGRRDFIDAGAKTANALIGGMDDSGFMPGRFRADFQPGARWACLTGSAQTGIVWGHLYRETADARYLEALQRVNRYLMRHHDVDNPDPVLRGGVPGAWPVTGPYGRLRILNWATSFFAESLLMELSLTRPGGTAP